MAGAWNFPSWRAVVTNPRVWLVSLQKPAMSIDCGMSLSLGIPAALNVDNGIMLREAPPSRIALLNSTSRTVAGT